MGVKYMEGNEPQPGIPNLLQHQRGSECLQKALDPLYIDVFLFIFLPSVHVTFSPIQRIAKHRHECKKTETQERL